MFLPFFFCGKIPERENMEQENRITKDYEELTLTDDFMFCKVLENAPDLAKELLELLLNIEIRKVEVQKQKTIDVYYDTKSIRLDVYIEDDNDAVYDIEMQTTHPKQLAKRSRYYQSALDTSLLKKGTKYQSLRKAYIIFICLSDPFAENRCMYTFENICKESKNLLLEDGTQKVFVNTKGNKEEISEELRNFLDYLENACVKDWFTQRLDEEVCVARTNEDWRRDYMMISAKYQDTYSEGEEEGQKKERHKVIKAALLNGLSEKEITKMFGYSKDEITKVAAELSQPTESGY